MISQNEFELLEFNKLLGIISDIAKSPASKKAILEIRPLVSIDDISIRQNLINEILIMYQEVNSLPIFSFPDLFHLFQKVRPEGAVLEGYELYGFLTLFDIISDIFSHINKRKNSPLLHNLTAPLTGFPEIQRALRKSIDSEGNIFDDASALLFELRGKARRLTGRIKKKLEEMLNDADVSKFLQDEFITQRSGRWVIPVRMDSKGQVAGVMHDVSSSGQTAFIEPITIISISNELENILVEQKAEEIRILQNLTSNIREVIDLIEVEFKIVVYFDVLNCISLLADKLKMEIPKLGSGNTISIVNARHPLLYLSFIKASYERQVVPLNVNLGSDNTVMVITGANAGGKTLAIKTIGLLLLMAMSGMPVPADSSSSFPIVNNILVDIGDEQSIENDLSTFSAHIKNISGIIRNSGTKTLVLIDEIGKGTDPDEGAALACAILNELKTRGAIVFATTHLSTIKGFVYKSKGMINASMEFDQNTFTPLYRLRVGEPGMSHAFETARKYGLQDSIIEDARRLLGNLKVELDNLIAELNEKRQYYEVSNLKVQGLQAELEEKNSLLLRKISDAEDSTRKILSNAYSEATTIISDARRDIYAIMADAKEKKKEALRQLNLRQREIEEKIRELDKDEYPVPEIDEIKEGDSVFVKSLGHDALVVGKNAKLKQLKIRTGGKNIIISLSDTGFSKGKPSKTTSETIESPVHDEISATLNIIGMRVDEALSRLEPFLNQTSLAGLGEVKIIHGIGKMILRKAVHEHIKGHPLVKDFNSSAFGEGGEGVTIVRLV